jgi:hypothetical protein
MPTSDTLLAPSPPAQGPFSPADHHHSPSILPSTSPRHPGSFLALAFLLSIVPLTAADWATGKNRFSLQSHIGFNIKTDFTELGTVSPQTNIGLDRGGVDHFYDDGFNRVDAGGNADGQTWFWGYENSSQIVDDSILMNSTATTPGSIRGISDAPYWGIELNYARELGWNGSYWWGVEIGVSWVNLDISQRRSLTTDAIRTVDAYPLGDLVPPPAPYSGTFSGPGPTIGDNPQRTFQTFSNAALTTGSYDLDATLYALRLGLIYETPFTDWFTLQFGGGILGAFIDSDFTHRESTSVQGLGSFQNSGSDSERDFLGGAYARAGFGMHFSPHAMASLGLQYNYLGSFSQESDGRRAKVDLKTSLYLALGVSVSF